jgi:DNA-binding GntR family transcriptional regulator
MQRIDPLSDTTFTYQLVADDIAARIAAGELTSQLPPERELARSYGVAYATQRRAMAVLRKRGLITTRQRPGTFSAPPPADR